MKIAYIGFGQLGIQIQSLAHTLLTVEKEIYFDDILFSKGIKGAFPFNQYLSNEYKNYSYLICLGYKHLKLKSKILDELINKDISLPSLIHPSCFVSKQATLGKSVIIYPMCNIDMNVQICNGCLLNNSVIVSHDSKVGECSFIAPGAIINGNSKLGNNCFIGAGSIISNGVTVGNEVQIGLGTVVTKSIEDKNNAIGNPMKILKKKLNIG